MNEVQYYLIRILGNDLVPRHKEGQTLTNLKFILDNEYPFENCHKFFILNRIIDKDYKSEIEKTLHESGATYVSLDFSPNEYLAAESKEMYLTNLNSARNTFLRNSPEDAVILPLDGNCFFRLDGWLRFVNSLEWGKGYAAIQMARCLTYPDPKSSQKVSWYENWKFSNRICYSPTEPQIAFLPGYDKIYDESLMYSEASKLGLLYTIGYRGVWDNWYPELKSKCLYEKSKHFGKTCEGGWCFRLPSGVDEAELDNQVRSSLRKQGLKRLVEHANTICSN